MMPTPRGLAGALSAQCRDRVVHFEEDPLTPDQVEEASSLKVGGHGALEPRHGESDAASLRVLDHLA